jgi:hypothetical protein
MEKLSIRSRHGLWQAGSLGKNCTLRKTVAFVTGRGNGCGLIFRFSGLFYRRAGHAIEHKSRMELSWFVEFW